jgi:hypothetical protein
MRTLHSTLAVLLVALVITLAGGAAVGAAADGMGPAARFSDPSGMAISADGSFALVANPDNQTLRRIGFVPVSPRVLLPLVWR